MKKQDPWSDEIAAKIEVSAAELVIIQYAILHELARVYKAPLANFCVDDLDLAQIRKNNCIKDLESSAKKCFLQEFQIEPFRNKVIN